MNAKALVRRLLNNLHLDLSKNLKYDRLTTAVMKKVIRRDSNCIDIGCHEGEVLQVILSLAPAGRHHAFEPLPSYFEKLKGKYGQKVELHGLALSDKSGETKFQYVINAPAFSGIKKRSYLVDEADIEEITVPLGKLDDIIPQGERIDFIKIDVEGGELDVIRGGRRILKECRPVVIFEFGKGAADHYGTTAEDIWSEFSEAALSLYTLDAFLKGQADMELDELRSHFDKGSEYYFIAAPA